MAEILLVRMKETATSDLLAGLCKTAAMGFQGVCPFPRCECPLMLEERCQRASPELWDEALHRTPKEVRSDE